MIAAVVHDQLPGIDADNDPSSITTSGTQQI